VCVGVGRRVWGGGRSQVLFRTCSVPSAMTRPSKTQTSALSVQSIKLDSEEERARRRTRCCESLARDSPRPSATFPESPKTQVGAKSGGEEASEKPEI